MSQRWDRKASKERKRVSAAHDGHRSRKLRPVLLEESSRETGAFTIREEMHRPPKRIRKSRRRDQIERLTARNGFSTSTSNIGLFPLSLTPYWGWVCPCFGGGL